MQTSPKKICTKRCIGFQSLALTVQGLPFGSVLLLPDRYIFQELPQKGQVETWHAPKCLYSASHLTDQINGWALGQKASSLRILKALLHSLLCSETLENSGAISNCSYEV